MGDEATRSYFQNGARLLFMLGQNRIIEYVFDKLPANYSLAGSLIAKPHLALKSHSETRRNERVEGTKADR